MPRDASALERTDIHVASLVLRSVSGRGRMGVSPQQSQRGDQRLKEVTPVGEPPFPEAAPLCPTALESLNAWVILTCRPGAALDPAGIPLGYVVVKG